MSVTSNPAPQDRDGEGEAELEFPFLDGPDSDPHSTASIGPALALHPAETAAESTASTSALASTTPSASDVDITLRTLEYFLVDSNCSLLFNPDHRDLRKCLIELSGRIESGQLSRNGLDLDSLNRKERLRKEKLAESAKQNRLKAADKKYINSVEMRKQRIDALQLLMEPQGRGEIQEIQHKFISHTSNHENPVDRSLSSLEHDSIINRVSSPPPPVTSVQSINHSNLIYRTFLPSTTSSSSVATKAYLRGDDPTNTNSNSNTNSTKHSKRREAKNKFEQEGFMLDQSRVSLSKDQQENESIENEKGTSEEPSSSSDGNSATFVHAGISYFSSDYGSELSYPRSCYSCKSRFFRLHRHYDQLCPPCAHLNWTKRHCPMKLEGKVALVTGCRVKIGYCIGLRLLRSGARLIATSRFPVDTCRRYSLESDFSVWKDRLHIYGLDLRDLQATTRFAYYISRAFSRLDILINNAAQTVRRPTAYYRHLIPIESLPSNQRPNEWNQCIINQEFHGNINSTPQLDHQSAEEKFKLNRASILIQEEDQQQKEKENLMQTIQSSAESSNAKLVSSPQSSSSSFFSRPAPLLVNSLSSQPSSTIPSGTSRSALLSQFPITSEDILPSSLSNCSSVPHVNDSSESLFPVGRFDVTGQQLDLRRENSWLLTLDAVSPAELMEVFAINVLSAYILCGHLRGIMANTAISNSNNNNNNNNDNNNSNKNNNNNVGASYIVNVSAMEGKFYRHKSPYHPHTNAAKAALNMIVRTAAQDYAKQRIFLNAVDTGWINDENPYERAAAIAETNFQTPIDEVDAAARILDPVIRGETEGIYAFGKFFKDFHETEW